MDYILSSITCNSTLYETNIENLCNIIKGLAIINLNYHRKQKYKQKLFDNECYKARISSVKQLKLIRKTNYNEHKQLYLKHNKFLRNCVKLKNLNFLRQ